jgi:hypothetical protein
MLKSCRAAPRSSPAADLPPWASCAPPRSAASRPALQATVCPHDLLAEVVWQSRFEDDVARTLCPLCEARDVVRIEPFEHVAKRLPRVWSSQRMAIGVGRDGVAARHAHIQGCELTMQLPQRGILAADERDVGDTERLESTDEAITGHEHLSRGGNLASVDPPSLIAALPDAVLNGKRCATGRREDVRAAGMHPWRRAPD